MCVIDYVRIPDAEIRYNLLKRGYDYTLYFYAYQLRMTHFAKQFMFFSLYFIHYNYNGSSEFVDFTRVYNYVTHGFIDF